MVVGGRRAGPAPRASQARGIVCRRARRTWELDKSMRVVPLGDDQLARRKSPKCAVRLPAGLVASDAGSNRKGQVVRAKLEAGAAASCCSLRTSKFRWRTHVTRSWFVPPIVIPLALFLSLMAYATLLAFH